MATKKPARKFNTDPVSSYDRDREDVRIEKISNGFLIARSGVKSGQYFEKKEYSPVDPLKKAAPAKAKARAR